MSSGPEGGVATVSESDPVSPEQIGAAEAYARTLLGDDVAEAAAQDAVAAFRRSLSAQDPAATATAGGAQNETLLALSRLMSAVSVPDRSSPADRRQAVWASIGQSAHCTCRESATLLATRANGNIQPRESHALDEHLAGCEDCRALAARAEAADAAFRAALAPRRGGAVGPLLGAIRRGPALGALAVLVAVVVAVVLLASGGSGSNTSRAAVVAPRAQPATAAPTPAAATRPRTASSRPHRVSHHHARRPLRHHHSPARHASDSPASATPVTSVAAENTASPGASSDATSSDAANSDAAGSQASSSAATAPSSTAAAAPSTASQVSGSSSLPAESAPQQGIGSATTTTP